MFTLYCTKKLLDRIGHPVTVPEPASTHLGNWYATAASVGRRFPEALKGLLKALDLPAEFIESEIDGMGDPVYSKAANRSVVGVMNEFAFLGEGYRDRNGLGAPLALSLKLAQTPCSPLYKGAVFPDRAVRDLVNSGGVDSTPSYETVKRLT